MTADPSVPVGAGNDREPLPSVCNHRSFSATCDECGFQIKYPLPGAGGGQDEREAESAEWSGHREKATPLIIGAGGGHTERESLCAFPGAEHDEVFPCHECERPVCGMCANTGDGNEWLCPDCASPSGGGHTADSETVQRVLDDYAGSLYRDRNGYRNTVAALKRLEAAANRTAEAEQDRDAAQRMANHMVALKGDNAWAIANSEKAQRVAAEAERDAALRGVLKGTAAVDLSRRNTELHAINAQVVRRAEAAEAERDEARRDFVRMCEKIYRIREAVGSALLISTEGETKMPREDWLRIEGACLAAGIETPVVAITESDAAHAREAKILANFQDEVVQSILVREERDAAHTALLKWQAVSPSHRNECLLLSTAGCTCGLQEARDLTRAVLGGPE